ncbi:MAG: DUF4290 domain-containing protein [Paludibacteraceae bacterium]|nr:DUF4290 domain-containing protein [Paludibacteraceae bacterium]MBR3520495.1 DUF4290 domain-containing protein [Paludibacteraceae bacterium]MBR4712369.1 DUF4290 domain-containing protein [Paludibacteraceae bacterium]MBR5375383.1 DUF4290 domain-containing protein [Paludibacteraceae bacterium]
MIYNTKMKRLALPEYGRNIQNMVDYCLTIEDREERTNCAYSIIATMGNLFPQLRDLSEFKHLLWDHLAIMSDFKLDIDYPYEVVKKETLNICPDRVPYSSPQSIRYRHYGKLVQGMIDKAVELTDPEEKKELSVYIANYMKKCYILYNKDGVADQKIFDDLRNLSKGDLRLSSDDVVLEDCKDLLATQVQASSKKKKKK